MNKRASSLQMSMTLRALAHLLKYPDDEQRAGLARIGAVLREEGALSAACCSEINALITGMRCANPFDVEALYLEFFERGRSTSLHLFEHVHGDSRKRGQAMVDLVRTYETAGLLFTDGELPDFLPVALEYASVLAYAEARDFLGEIAHILNAVHNALQQRNADYVSVFAALLELAGAEIRPGSVASDHVPSIDEAWQEPKAFSGCVTESQLPASHLHPIHFVRQASSPDIGAAK